MLCRFGVVGICLFATLGGCSQPKNMVILLPEEDGTVGKVSLSNAQGSQLLDQPWQSTGVTDAEEAPRSPRLMPEAQVQSQFGEVLANQPLRPICFILYFQQDSTKLTAASQAQLPEVVAAIAERQSVDTSVVGHTDSMGSNGYNVRLSRDRAEIIARQLVVAGVDPTILAVSSHGERNPLIPTPDNVFEPRNRRVEITVR